MKRGKRKYVTPLITKEIIDNEISLVMMTWTPGSGKPPGPPGQGKKEAFSNDPTQSPAGNPFDTNPFGN